MRARKSCRKCCRQWIAVALFFGAFAFTNISPASGQQSVSGAIRTANGHFLTAVQGGGVEGAPGVDIETNLSNDSLPLTALFNFRWVNQSQCSFSLQTWSGPSEYVTAVNGGGIGGPNNSPIHTDASTVGPWEQFTIIGPGILNQGGGQVVLQTPDGKHLVSLVADYSGGTNNPPIGLSATSGGPWETLTLSPPNCVLPLLGGLELKILTGNDNARSDTELLVTWAGVVNMGAGYPLVPFRVTSCLKPSNNAQPSENCANGPNAEDQQKHQEWANWTESDQVFTVGGTFAGPQFVTLSSLTSLTISLIEHNNGLETDDNWDIQGVAVIASGLRSDGTHYTGATLLNIANPKDPQNSSNCLARLTGSKASVTFTLNPADPTGSNPGFPPGSCRQ